MAIMIPEVPREFHPASQEGLIFDALSTLPDSYYVVHSFKTSRVLEDELVEREMDFLIFNPSKGVLCLEAKAGAVRYENGNWLYSNGIPMKHGGPFNQAARNKYELMDSIRHSALKQMLSHCKFLHAVWFPSISSESECYKKIKFPADAEKKLTLTKEALYNPEESINAIFDIETETRVKTSLSSREVSKFIRDILCPQFGIFPSANFEDDVKKVVFNRLLKEQEGVLNYLADQRTVAINGAAGTGKTMIAVEKATRDAAKGEKVLFLCYNAALKTYLNETYPNDNIDYYTLSGYASKMLKTSEADLSKLNRYITDLVLSDRFPYDHVVVDEGQDFGMAAVEESSILETLQMAISMREDDRGSFYIFYDRLQLVQSKRIPDYIADSDCKLTLYKNCRNTENIAITSLKPISERKAKLKDGTIKGEFANIVYANDVSGVIENIDSSINRLKLKGIEDIVILTCKTESSSVISDKVVVGCYKGIKFTTCRKFKGLESDAVILIDVDSKTFYGDNVMLFYVGASRAKLYLDIVTTINDDEAKDILEKSLNYDKKVRRGRQSLASALNATSLLQGVMAVTE